MSPSNTTRTATDSSRCVVSTAPRLESLSIGAERLRRTMADTSRDVLYVAGHLHRHSSAHDPESSDFHEVASPGIFKQWGPVKRYCGFLEIKAAPEKIEVRPHMKERDWRPEAVESGRIGLPSGVSTRPPR